MSMKITKNRKRINITILIIAISSMSVFLATPNSLAVVPNILKIIKIEPQRKLTVGELVLIKGEIKPGNQIFSVEITSDCGDTKSGTISMDEWEANYTFLRAGECEIEVTGKNNANPPKVVAIDSFNVEVVLIEEVRDMLYWLSPELKNFRSKISGISEISDEISAGKDILFFLGIVVVISCVFLLIILCLGPDINHKLSLINNKLTLNENPSIENIEPKEAELKSNHKITIRGNNLDKNPKVSLRDPRSYKNIGKVNLTRYENEKIMIQLKLPQEITNLEETQDFHLIVDTEKGSAMHIFKLITQRKSEKS